MELNHDFEVSVPVDQAWAVLTDLERIAPCLPGAQLQEVDGDEYRGVVKVKVGPITAQYKGKASFLERDEQAGRAVLEASGRDTRGQGNASAVITAELEPAGGATKVRLTTDLTISGKVAQFGRGALADVSQKLLGQFVENLETTVLASTATPSGADGEPTAASEAPATEQSPGWQPAEPLHPEQDPAPIDLLETAGVPLLKRFLPVFGLAVAIVLLLGWTRRRNRGG